MQHEYVCMLFVYVNAIYFDLSGVDFLLQVCDWILGRKKVCLMFCGFLSSFPGDGVLRWPCLRGQAQVYIQKRPGETRGKCQHCISVDCLSNWLSAEEQTSSCWNWQVALKVFSGSAQIACFNVMIVDKDFVVFFFIKKQVNINALAVAISFTLYLLWLHCLSWDLH